MIDIDIARQIISSDGFFRNHEVDVLSIENGKTVLSVPLADNVMRIGGIMSGPAIMAFADVASAFCVMSAEGVLNEVTANLNTSFYVPVRNGPARFTASLRKMGKTLAYTHVEVTDADGVLCAESTGTYYLIRE